MTDAERLALMERLGNAVARLEAAAHAQTRTQANVAAVQREVRLLATLVLIGAALHQFAAG